VGLARVPSGLGCIVACSFRLLVHVTRRQKMPVWKNSLLVWFLQGGHYHAAADGEGVVAHQYHSPDKATIESIEQISRHIIVTLLNRDQVRIEVVDTIAMGEGGD